MEDNRDKSLALSKAYSYPDLRWGAFGRAQGSSGPCRRALEAAGFPVIRGQPSPQMCLLQWLLLPCMVWPRR